MRTAIISFYEAWPPVSGAATVTFNLARFLPGVRMLVQMGRRAAETCVDGVRVVTLGGYSDERVAKLAGLNRRTRRIANELWTFAPDVVVLEGASWVVYHRMLLARLRRVIPSARIVYHSHNVEYDLRAARHGRAVAALTRWAEGSLLRAADLATAVSPVDQARFGELYGITPALVPNGVDIERFARVTESSVAQMRSTHGVGTHTLLFSGFYAYPPNREAIDFIVKSIMPALREHFPVANLVLTGGGAPYEESWIKNFGSVPYEDFADLVASCGIAVAPIFSGSGTRLKVLEAMAAGLPVVATEKAVEGLGLLNGKQFLRASTAEEFSSAIAWLWKNPAIAERMRSSAQVKAKEFSWRAITPDFVHLNADSSSSLGIASIEDTLSTLTSRVVAEEQRIRTYSSI